ncbi:hypothetical protein [Bacillus cereus]|uniref:Uncharacterized protein n=1 Tax=Bacillus cereus TaxID=1396 RepID=A0A9X6X552_BACCE|nr:hypothetical protein [Bacillus cereus]PFK27797.1 hypothetical protein COI98_01355 [Bacillus cereus]QPW51559.1 hypothetical protein G9298_28165 [Bacillus thuringiensis]
MLENQKCTVVSSFTKENKLYVTLELDLSSFNINERGITPRDLSIGDFRIDVNSNNGDLSISLFYGDTRITDWNIRVPDGTCINLGEQDFDIFGFGVGIKNIQVCLRGSDVCFKASAFVSVPILGDQHIGDIDLCASNVL